MHSLMIVAYLVCLVFVRLARGVWRRFGCVVPSLLCAAAGWVWGVAGIAALAALAVACSAAMFTARAVRNESRHIGRNARRIRRFMRPRRHR